MAGIGELFIELGVIGDTKDLEKAKLKTLELAKAFEDAAKAARKQILFENELGQINEQIEQVQQKAAQAIDETTKAKAQETLKTLEARKAKILDAQAAERQADSLHNEAEKQSRALDKKKQFSAEIRNAVKGIGIFTGAVSAAGIALNRLANDLIKSNQAMLNLTRTTDIAQSTFQKWGGIGKMLGIENAESGLEGLNSRLFALRLTGEGARGFQLAGINPINTDAEGVLEQLRNRISTMNDSAASYLLQQMGLDPNMLHLLRLTKEEFDALWKTIEKYQLTSEQSRQIQQMNIQLQIAGIQLKYLKDSAILALMPYWAAFVKFIERCAQALVNAVKWIKTSTSGWAALTRIILGVITAAAALAGILKTLPVILKGIAAAVGLVRGAIMLLTAHPIAAAVSALLGAIALIADDIWHYFNGGGSLIGVIAKGLQDLDLKGFIDFPVPKWLEYLIKVIDFYRDGGRIVLSDDADKSLTPREKFRKNIERAAKGAAKITTFSTGLSGNIPHLSRDVVNNVENNVNNTDNKTNNKNISINQDIQITTNQPADDIQRQLVNAGYAFA